MSTPEIISNFRGPYFFLSNFYLVYIQLDNDIYPSVEHAYQAAKTLNLNQRRQILYAGTPSIAKQLGKKVDLRLDWNDSLKVSVMKDLLRQKFDPTINSALYSMLESTGDSEIVKGNTWGDTFWGVCRGKGNNHLGRLLMEIRDEYKNYI